MKSKKHKKEITKFCHNLEKFHDNYNYEQKLKETNISDKKKSIQNYITRMMKENKKNNKDFISNLLAFMKRLPENLFQINLMKNPENPGSFIVSDTKIPKKVHLKTNISRSDEIWKNFKYKNLNSAQLFKRYRKIIVGTKIHKNINSIKKLGNLKEIADMRAIKKLMNIQKDEDFHIKDRIYETRKQLKPISSNKAKTQLFLKKTDYFTKESSLIEQPFEQDLRLYCLCKRLYTDGELMMNCEKCNDWLHFQCIGYLGEVGSKQTEELKFICPNCDEKDGEEEREIRKKEYDTLFSKYYKQNDNENNDKKEDKCEESEKKEDVFLEKYEENKEAKKKCGMIKENGEIWNASLVELENLDKIEEIIKENKATEENKENFNYIESNLVVKIDNLEKMEIENEISMFESEDIKKNKKENSSSMIEFNCITKDNLQNEPINNFNNKKITDYFNIFPKSTYFIKYL